MNPIFASMPYKMVKTNGGNAENISTIEGKKAVGPPVIRFAAVVMSQDALTGDINCS